MKGIEDILKSLLRQNPDLYDGVKEERVLACWAEAVGPMIAKKTRAIGFKENALIIEVDHPLWKQELYTNKNTILAKFHKVSGSKRARDLTFVDPVR